MSSVFNTEGTNARGFSSTGSLRSLKYEYEREYARRALRDKGRPCHAGNAPRAHHYDVEHDVAHRRDDEENKGRTAVAEG